MNTDKLATLIEALGKKDKSTRTNAYFAIIEIGKPAVPALVKALDGNLYEARPSGLLGKVVYVLTKSLGQGNLSADRFRHEVTKGAPW